MRIRPVAPGVPHSARRPGLLCLWPAWSLTLLAAGSALTAMSYGILRWIPGDQIAPIKVTLGNDLFQTIGICATGIAALVGWELRTRQENYRRFTEKIGEIGVAWESLKRASGVGWATEKQLLKILSTDARKIPQHTLSRAREIEEELRDVSAIPRPTTFADLRTWRRDRHRQVRRIAADLSRLLAGNDGGRANNHRQDHTLRNTANTDESLQRLDQAFAEWERAMATVRSETSRFPVLDDLAVRADVLVQHWWVYAQNDPWYKDLVDDVPERDSRRPPLTGTPRDRAFSNARDSVEDLCEGVRQRDIGHPWWRSLLLRACTGERLLASADRRNEMVF